MKDKNVSCMSSGRATTKAQGREGGITAGKDLCTWDRRTGPLSIWPFWKKRASTGTFLGLKLVCLVIDREPQKQPWACCISWTIHFPIKDCTVNSFGMDAGQASHTCDVPCNVLNSLGYLKLLNVFRPMVWCSPMLWVKLSISPCMHNCRFCCIWAGWTTGGEFLNDMVGSLERISHYTAVSTCNSYCWEQFRWVPPCQKSHFPEAQL